MKSELPERFESWIRYFFDHEVRDPEWYWDTDAPDFEVTAEEGVELITATFQKAGECLRPYSNGQLEQGLWYMNSGWSGYINFVSDSEVALEKRLEAIRSIVDLYRDCFAPRCEEVLAARDENENELNGICYMFWDISPLAYLEGNVHRKEISETVFSVLESILQINHRACRESALHGLGHIFSEGEDGRTVERIIDRFLKNHYVDENLMDYAADARKGIIQ